MSPQTQEPGIFIHPCFLPLGLGPAGPSPSNSLTAAVGHQAAGSAAKGRAGLLSMPRELQTLQECMQDLLRASHITHAQGPASLASLKTALPCWRLPAIPWRGGCPFLGDVPLQGHSTQCLSRVGVTFVKHSCPYAFLAGKSGGGWREFATCVRN